MKAIGFEIIIIVVLILANGIFAMAEIAVVVARKERLRMRAAQGSSRAQAALDLAESPNRFLATVQIGITLAGIPGVLAAAFIVRSIPLGALRWLVIGVVVYTALMMLRSARR